MRIGCPYCGKSFEAPQDTAEQVILCGHCSSEIRLKIPPQTPSQSVEISTPCPICGSGGPFEGRGCGHCREDLRNELLPQQSFERSSEDENEESLRPSRSNGNLRLGLLTKLLIGTLVCLMPLLLIISPMCFNLDDPDQFYWVFRVNLSAVLVSWLLIGFHIYCLFKTDRVKDHVKVWWLLLFLFFGTFSMPVFFFLYIWPESTRRARGRTRQLQH